MDDSYCVMMFVKSPEEGMIKSRLAASVGKSVALNLYKCFVTDTMGMLVKNRYPLRIFFYPPEARQQVEQWLGKETILIPQAGDNLGDRMKNAFESVFSQGIDRALLIGSDSPDLPSTIIEEAFETLKKHDAVVGPSYDGGYYLIGFRRDTFCPLVFNGIVWSTTEVFEQTTDILRKSSVTPYILPLWRDIDTLDNLDALILDNRNTPFARSATMEYVEKNSLVYYK
jgi:uncharacterized protein